MRRSRRLALWLLLGLIVWGFTDIRGRAAYDPDRPLDHRTDFTVYTAAGRALLDGDDPYAATNPRGWTYLYPPLLAIVVAPLSYLDPQWQGVAWFLISLALACGCVRECRRLPRGHAWCAAAVVALPALNTLQRGQVGIAILYPLLLGLRLLLQSRPLLAGIVLALPVAIRITPALPVGVLLFWHVARGRGGRLAAGCALGAVLFFAAIPSAVTGWTANARNLETWARTIAADPEIGVKRGFNPHSGRNQSLENAARRLASFLDRAPQDRLLDDHRRWMDAPPIDRRPVLVLSALGLAFLLVVAWRCGQPAAVFGLGCLASLVFSPVSWGHAYVLFLPAVLFAPSRRLAVAAAALPLLHYSLLPLSGRLGLLGLGATAWLFAGGITCLRSR